MTLAATALAVLAAPAAAHAATYTVKAGDGPCGGGDLACGGLVEAAAAAAAGDVFNVTAGTYTSAKFNTDVTINGTAGFVIDGTLEFAGGAVSKLSKVAVVTGAGNAPAVYVSGGNGLELSDAVVVSRDGFGIFITSGAGNKIVRSGVVTGGQATGAIQVQTGPDDADVSVTVESTILSGGGAGIRAFTRNNEAEGLATRAAGDIDLTLRHITAAGSTNGIDLDSSNSRTLLLGTSGNIVATVSDSIALNNRVVNFPGTLGLSPLGANTATLTRTRTLESGDPAALFVDPAGSNFHLRQDASAAINQGGVTPGESATDVDGQDRSTAPTDLGADEWYPGPPPPGPTPGAAQNDGTAPAIAVTSPKAGQKIKKATTKTRTVTVRGKKVKRRTTTRLSRLRITGTAKDPSGVKAVVVTIQKLGTAAGAKCKWFNATKGVVLKSCAKPPLLVARLAADGTWSFNANARRLSAGNYRIIVFGADNSGAAGNSASRGDAVRRFTLTNK